MVTGPNEWKILEWDENLKQTISYIAYTVKPP